VEKHIYTQIHIYPMSEKSRLDVKISKELELEFRKEVARRLGMKKGNLSLAFEEAIRNWIAAGRKKQR